MRLLLDEMYAPTIAAQLRKGGHDVEAISGSPHAGMSDSQVLEAAAGQGRALVTNNVRDFVRVHGDVLRAGDHHFGIVFTDDRSMPRGKGSIGLYVKTLGALLKARPTEDALRDGLHWLP